MPRGHCKYYATSSKLLFASSRSQMSFLNNFYYMDRCRFWISIHWFKFHLNWLKFGEAMLRILENVKLCQTFIKFCRSWKKKSARALSSASCCKCLWWQSWASWMSWVSWSAVSTGSWDVTGCPRRKGADWVSVAWIMLSYFGDVDEICKVGIWRGDVLKFRWSKNYPPLVHVLFLEKVNERGI
jgi:hypothetical protein